MTHYLAMGSLVLSLLMLDAGCSKPDPRRPGRCVSKGGQEIPCDALERPDPNAPRKPARARSEPVRPDPSDRRAALERITGATSCGEVAKRYARLHTFGPPCETADDCGWTEYLALTCGKAVHKAGVQRGEELEELDRLLRCGRMIPKCRMVSDHSVLTCQDGRCVGVERRAEP